MTYPTDDELDALVKLTEEFVTATWHLLDNSETSGPKDDPTIAVWQPNFDEVSALLDRCEGLPSGSMEHMAAGELLAANMTAAIAAMRAQLAAANARVKTLEGARDRAEQIIVALVADDPTDIRCAAQVGESLWLKFGPMGEVESVSDEPMEGHQEYARIRSALAAWKEEK